MDRRNAIMTISGVLATSALAALPRRAAFAQSVPRPAVPPVAPTGPLDLAQYTAQTLLIGTFSKDISQIAMTKTTHPRLREFAGFEAAEQATMAQVLTGEANPAPAALDPQHSDMLDFLQGQTGKAFDMAYVTDQIAGHRALFAIQQGYLDGNPTDRDHEHIAMLARTVIQMHLTMLQDLQQQLAA